MNFNEFEQLVSTARLFPYRNVTGDDKRKAKNLYRLNIQLSSELFTIIAYFEVALRNAIHNHYSYHFNNTDWIRDSVLPKGMFDVPKLQQQKKKYSKHPTQSETITDVINALRKLGTDYSSDKIVAELNFGYWRYLFADTQYDCGGKSLLKIFTNKPKSTPLLRYDHNYIFASLGRINNMRNRVAHHEPIIFSYQNKIKVKSTASVRVCYQNMVELLSWMPVDAKRYWLGLDHIIALCDKIDRI